MAARAERVIEVSPSYIYYSQVSERIYSELGQVKIIALLRNPVEKAFSQYMHLLRLNRETLDFYAALMAEEQRRASGWVDTSWYYAESSLYAERISKYISVFGKDNVRIILFEDLVQAPEQVMRDLFEFLQVDTSFQPNTSSLQPLGAAKVKDDSQFFL